MRREGGSGRRVASPTMRFGLALDLGAHDEGLHDRFASSRRLLAAAERQGFESVWLGESYPSTDSFFHISSPFTVLAALATSTTMTLGTGVTLLAAWDPLRLAYDLAVLDHLSGGNRLVLGAAVGNPPIWTRFGTPRERLADRMDETVQALKALWSGADGFHGEVIDVAGGVRPLPLTPGGPPIWWGGSAGRAIRRAATLADGWYAATQYRRTDIAALAARFRAQRPAGTGDAPVAVNRMAMLHDSRESALASYGDAFTALANIYAGFGALRDPDGAVARPGADILERIADEVVLVGSADDVNQQIDSYVQAGVTHLQLRIRPAGVAVEAAIDMVERFGELVLPNWR